MLVPTVFHCIDGAFALKLQWVPCPKSCPMTARTEPLSDTLLMMMVETIAWLWRTSCWPVIALGFIPFPPFQWWALYTAISHGRTRAVKLLARRWVFALMPASVNAKIMLRAGYRASKSHSTTANKRIFEWLLDHGGIISKKSFYKGCLYTEFDLGGFACHEGWVERAMEHNAIADDTKYELLLDCLKYGFYGSKHVEANNRRVRLCATIVSIWGPFFNALQNDEEIRATLWKSVLEDGSPETVNTLLLHTPTAHIAKVMELVVHSRKCSLDTLHAVATHGDVHNTLNQVYEKYSSRFFRTPPDFETWLSDYTHLSGVYTAYCNEQQNQLLKTHIKEYEPAPSKRKM